MLLDFVLSACHVQLHAPRGRVRCDWQIVVLQITADYSMS